MFIYNTLNSKKQIQKTTILLYILVFLVTLSSVKAEIFSAKEVVVYDFNTQELLYTKNPNKRMYPASITKIMVAYIVFQQLKNHTLKLTNNFIVSKKAAHTPGSSMFLREGQTVSVENLIKGLLTVSGNDAAVTLAEGIAGSTENFVQLMNNHAKTLGLNNTHYMNVDGLPNKNHYSTVMDLLTLSIALIKNYPTLYKNYFSIKYFKFNKINQRNRNPLLFIGQLDADGIKTGHTEAAGYCLVGSVLASSGRRIIFVIAGLPSARSLQRESVHITRNSLYMWDDYQLLAPNTLPHVQVVGGIYNQVALTTKVPLIISLQKYMLSNIIIRATYFKQIQAPVHKRQVLGSLNITITGTKRHWSVPLIAKETVKKPFILFRGWYNLMTLISSTAH